MLSVRGIHTLAAGNHRGGGRGSTFVLSGRHRNFRIWKMFDKIGKGQHNMVAAELNFLAWMTMSMVLGMPGKKVCIRWCVHTWRAWAGWGGFRRWGRLLKGF